MNEITIPKHLLYTGITPKGKKFAEEAVKESREVLRAAPTFSTADEAVRVAVAIYKEAEDRGDVALPSVWKEPSDIGSKYAVVDHELREDAYDAGYTEVADDQKIVDIVLGRDSFNLDEVEKPDIDHIEEN